MHGIDIILGNVMPVETDAKYFFRSKRRRDDCIEVLKTFKCRRHKPCWGVMIRPEGAWTIYDPEGTIEGYASEREANAVIKESLRIIEQYRGEYISPDRRGLPQLQIT